MKSLEQELKHVGSFITMNELRHHFGVSRTSAYRWMKTEKFPRPYQVAEGSLKFRKLEIIEWMKSRNKAVIHNSGNVPTHCSKCKRPLDRD